ncbi:MAG: ECF transporter S component [Oscillospiraceae bacterium]|nr:ECF transporter S component [Oscillospiraceae bacterium]
MKQSKTLRVTTLAVFAAIAYLMTFITHNIKIMPSAPFLSLDMKDVVIVLAGFQFGPLAAAALSLVVSFIEMITISSSGIIGMVMNVISTCAFACTASFIFRKKRTFVGAVTGLVLGTLLATAMMLLWNLIITPFYMNVTTEQVVGMLAPIFLPFNLLKYGINSVAAAILFTPLIHIMRKYAGFGEAA